MEKRSIKRKLENKVEGLGVVYYIEKPFDYSLESLREFGIENPITSRDLVYARRIRGRQSSLSSYGSYCREGFLYAGNESVLLALISPLLNLELAQQAVLANRQGKYFSTNRGVYYEYREIAEQDKTNEPEERKVLILPSRKSFDITKNENFDIFRALLKDQAELYMDFLKRNGINKVSVFLQIGSRKYVDSQEGTILTQLWFHGLDYWSNLDGIRYLDYDISTRGVLKKTNEVSRVFEKASEKENQR